MSGTETETGTGTGTGTGADSRRERILFAAVFGALSVAALVPLWALRYQPLPDLAQHLAAASVWLHFDDPAYDFQRYYALRLGGAPYWGYHLLMRGLGALLGVGGANRVVLSLYVVGTPLAAAWLARRLGRSPWLALFAFPLTWNFSFASGFINSCLGWTLSLAALACFDRFCARPTPARALAAVALGGGLFFVHLLPWGLYLGCAGLIAFLHEGGGGRRLLGRLAVWAAALAVGVAVLRWGSGLHMGEVAGARFSATFHSLGQELHDLYLSVWDNWTTHEDDAIALVLLAAWLALLLTGRRPRRLHELRAEACFAVAMAGYLLLPRSVVEPAYWWGVNVRFAPPALLFAALSVGGPIAGRRRWLLAPVAAGALAFSLALTVHWVRDLRFTAGYDELRLVPERGARVLFVTWRPWHEATERQNYAQMFAQLYQAERGGYMPWNFDEGFPLVYVARYPAPKWREQRFDWEQHARYYDYVFTFQLGENDLFGGHARDVKLVASSGKWSLWKLPGPRVDAPPGPAYPSAWAFDPLWRPSR